MRFILSLCFSVIICAVPSADDVFDDVNILLLHAVCLQYLKNCSMLDGVKGLFMVNISRVSGMLYSVVFSST